MFLEKFKPLKRFFELHYVSKSVKVRVIYTEVFQQTLIFESDILVKGFQFEIHLSKILVIFLNE